MLLTVAGGCSDSPEEPAGDGVDEGREPSDPCGGLDEEPEFLVELAMVERRVWVVVSPFAEDRYAEVISVLEPDGPSDRGYGISISTSATVIELTEGPGDEGQIELALARLDDAGFGPADYTAVDPDACDL